MFIAGGGPSPVACGGATGTRRAPPVPTWVLPDGVIGVEAAPARLELVPRRAPQIAPSPAEWTRGSSLRNPSSLPSTINSHDLSREVGKRIRVRPVPSPSLPRGSPDRRGGSVPVRQPGPKEYR